jgi:hypothetical protein
MEDRKTMEEDQTDEELSKMLDEAASRPVTASAPRSPVRRTRGLLNATMGRNTTSNGVIVKGMPKRRITFVISAAACSPGVFTEDFELTLESLTSESELAAARRSKGDQTSLAFLFAYYGMAAVNGDPINDAEAEREWLWEALGPARQLVMGLFARGCMVDAESQGKAFSSFRVD